MSVIQLSNVRDLNVSFQMETYLRAARGHLDDALRHAAQSAPHQALNALLKAKGCLMSAEAIRLEHQKSKEQT